MSQPQFTMRDVAIRRKRNGEYEINSADGALGFALVWGPEAEAAANARLIAAASRMYWALTDIRDFLKSHGYDITLVDEVLREVEVQP